MNKNEYTRDYNRVNYKSYTFRLHKQQDLPIIRALDESGSPTQMIRRLILEDLQRRGVDAHTEMLRPRHDDVSGYPFEVIEFLPFNDHYTVGYYKDLNKARDGLASYVMEHGATGALRIIRRESRQLGTSLILVGGVK